MNETNIHAGHRERLLKTVYEGNFRTLSKYQQTEVLLFYVFPRGDVNPLAHRLIDFFGSFSAILDASVEELSAIKGMGYMTAIKIKNLLNLFKRYGEDKFENKVSLVTIGELGDNVEELLRYRDVEETVAISLDRKNLCNGVRMIAIGNDHNVSLDIKAIYKFIDTYHSHGIILAHNHPGGTCYPSQTDLKSYEEIGYALFTYGSKLEDSLIVGSEGVYSIKNKRIIRDFSGKAYKTLMDLLEKRNNNDNT